MQLTNHSQFFISTDKIKINVHLVHDYLCNQSYWAKNIPLAVVTKSIENSFCFGVYKNDDNNNFEQVGFARVITDYATFGYLVDVFILEQYRGKALGKWLVQEIMNHEALQGLRRIMLATKDAHGLYEQFGFAKIEMDGRLMGIKFFNEY